MNRYTILILRYFFSIVFIIASVPKIINPQKFLITVYNYKILSSLLLPAFTAALPWIELIAGVCLLSEAFASPGLLVIILLLFIFVLAIIIDIYLGIDPYCGCFSGSLGYSRIGWEVLLRDICLLLLAIILYYKLTSRRRNKPNPNEYK
ncbi:MAG: MauE/DoxX family redox-associated membrane protein [Thermodesulfobacteriota bacterium]|nr:MauE/DoxX family redox-associated membrane protein [Thermodesulfobacteriota bacterium]